MSGAISRRSRRCSPWVAAGERGGFTAAAQALGVTQSAISREIRQIEERLGRALFRRSPRGVELTEEGRQFMEAARAGLQEIAGAVARIRATDKPRQLTIGCDFAYSAHWLVPRLPKFAEQEPEVDVRVVTAQHVERAIGDCDIAILFGSGDWPGIAARRINQEAVFPVCAPNYPTGPMTGRPDWLAEANLLKLLDGEDGSDWFDWPGYFAAAGVPLSREEPRPRPRQLPAGAAGGDRGAGHRARLVADDRAFDRERPAPPRPRLHRPFDPRLLPRPPAERRRQSAR